MIFSRLDESRLISEASSIMIDLGYSFPSIYAIPYFPLLELISIVLFSLMENVKGCSGSDLIMSVSNFAGIAILTFKLDSIDNLLVNDVSKSDEVIFNSLLSISKRKLSKIGNVLLVLRIVPKTCKFFNKSELDTINFIFIKIFYLTCNLKLNY